MYSASTAFHNAVAQGKPQMALFAFDDAVFTNSDIDVSAGIEFNDYFCTEEDITIGQALSNELIFGLFNDKRLLNDYEFGDFTALLGVQTGTGTYTNGNYVYAKTGTVEWTGYTTTPYLKRAGTAVSSQPNFPVKCIIIYGNYVYAFGDNDFKAYTKSGSAATRQLNSFMQDKAKRLFGMGATCDVSAKTVKLFYRGIREDYEFVPLGKFTAERPNVPDVIEIRFSCNDFMTKFDKDMPSKTELGITYPITIGDLFAAICNYVGVNYASTTFINSTATITKEPEEFGNATMRQVLQWIAEAAASVLRFDRDGVLVFDWLRTTGLELTENNYSEYAPYWYETKRIDKLYNRTSANGTDRTVGDGDNAYLIQDNPLLKGVS